MYHNVCVNQGGTDHNR